MKKEFNFKNQYLKSWKYLKASKDFIYFIIFLFFLIALMGFFIIPSEALTERILEFMRELLALTKGLSAIGLVKFIFLNNLKSSFIGMASGIIFGIIPMFTLIANAYLLGFVSSMAVESNSFLSLWRLLPHGIFELPALFISLALGLKLGSFIFQKDKIDSLKKFVLESLRVFVLIVVPLLIIAAIIEGVLIFFFK